ncbi:hypothetical protein P153DRAFT_339924 [Dothidotthia symphoricarpi CBS 119687]|uniref:Uncharacterized protein n=1 Tax=Dothidotthia symphoricarpi CBS 119687 TaxID=1392245 RepID=A0A6A6ADC0_9PLEO|nr:uncharacterized protein P153DRAFT_339924 [Dothidotthia symphoricarpi CBS 119687]KAF2129263.1 hypothetical protein P153DRAFT_339924 [Dothidotthia symphoricarpi CBS 119687]
MASRDPLSPQSSRSMSPDNDLEHYDTFHSQSDPVEMSLLSGPLAHFEDFHDSRDRPSEARRSLRPGTFLPMSPDSGQYEPLRERNTSPGPTGRESIYTLNSIYHHKTTNADTQALVDRRAGELAKWHVHWTTPALIAGLFTAGVAAAIGHHLFYASLDGHPATEQLMMVRYGTAFAYFFKSMLVGTVVICYRQRIWHTFRTKAMTMNGIDGLFSATEDPTQFFLNWEMLRNGKLATVMALCSWLIPMASVLSPASLTSEARTYHDQTTCPNVPILNFTRESYYNFRVTDSANFSGASVSYYNTTDRYGKTEGFFDYYDQPSKNARRSAYSAAYLKKAQARENAAAISCDQGWNCTYNINFMGPGYKCDYINDTLSADLPFTSDILAPQGDLIYHSVLDTHDYASPQIDTVEGVPKQSAPYPDWLGVFDSEPVIWIGYAEKTNELYADDSPYAKKWKYVHESKMFKCVLHHTNYTIEMKYSPTQQTSIKQRDYLGPVVDTTVTHPPHDARNNNTDWVASPSSNFISPRSDVAAYKLTAAYHSVAALLRNFLRGEIEKTSNVFIVTRSDMSETKLVDSATAYPVSHLMDAVQDLLEDMLITLLSDPSLVISDTCQVPCDRSRTMVVYVYYRRSLWFGYTVALVLTVASVVVGSWAIHVNGVASDTLFSRILVTTRNPTLDQLSVGACLGGDPFPEELQNTKLRFGVLLEDDPREGPLGKVEHCCFGTVGDTKEIVRHGNYAGLKKWRKAYEGGEVGDAKEKETLLGEKGV